MRRVHRGLLVAAVLLGALPVRAAAQAPAGAGGEAGRAHRVARELAQLGPRLPGTEAHRRAAALLLEEMERLGLAGVGSVEHTDPSLRTLTGVLPGAGDGEIVLAAHYDTVAGSPGATDDAAGCGVALAAVGDLARTPLERSVRVMLFDGEEAGLAGSRAWLAGLSPHRREGILAAVDLDLLGWAPGAGPVLSTMPATAGGRRRDAPGWLVHAGLRACEAVGAPCAFLDRRRPLAAQLLSRAGRVPFSADSAAFLEAGVPAVLLTDHALTRHDPAYHGSGDRADRLDPEALAVRTEVTAALVRRLDVLAGRPRWEDRFLVLGGQVWLRRDLYWVGFPLWGCLVLRSAWRRRRGGKVAPRGLAFRLLFLVSTIAWPVLSAVLLYPAGALALFPPESRPGRLAWVALGLAPAALLATGLAVAAAQGWVAGHALSLPALLSLTGTLATYAASLWLEEPTSVSVPSTRASASPGRP